MQPSVPLIPHSPGFSACLKPCFEMVPTLEIAMSNAEEPKMDSQVIVTDNSYLPATGLSS